MTRTCLWRWIGDVWDQETFCQQGQSCPAPGFDGTYTGQTALTDCEGP